MRSATVILGILAGIVLIVPSVLAQGENDGFLPLLIVDGTPGPNRTETPTQIVTATPEGVEESTPTTTPTGTLTVVPTGSPTTTGTVTAEPTETAEPSETPTSTPTATETVIGPTPTNTPTPTSTETVVAPTPTYTPTATPGCQVAPEDASFNAPLDIPLDTTTSVLDFVSFPAGDSFDRSRYSVTGMNSNPSLPGGQARLVIAVSCFGEGTDSIEITSGGSTYSCGDTVVDRIVTADSDTGTINIEAVGGACTYVQWVMTGTATRQN